MCWTVHHDNEVPMNKNGRQVARKERIRGTDLPVGITDTLQISRQGKEQHLITVQVCFNRVA